MVGVCVCVCVLCSHQMDHMRAPAPVWDTRTHSSHMAIYQSEA